MTFKVKWCDICLHISNFCDNRGTQKNYCNCPHKLRQILALCTFTPTYNHYHVNLNFVILQVEEDMEFRCMTYYFSPQDLSRCWDLPWTQVYAL